MNENTKQKIIEARVYRKLYQGFFERKVNGVVVKTNRVDEISPNLQAVHTPYELCYDMVAKLCENSGSLAGKEILVFNLEFAEVLLYDEVGFGAEASRITFVTDCLEKFVFSTAGRYAGIKRVFKSFDDIKKLELNMKFDVVIMNPPYQQKSDVANTKTQSIWPLFVQLAFKIAKKDGYVCAVHPSSWRSPDGMFMAVKKLLTSKKMQYLEMHDIGTGLRTFGAKTNYDIYCVQNTENNVKTDIVFVDGTTSQYNISHLEFIPDSDFQEIIKLFAKDNEPKVTILADSKYHTQSRTQEGSLSKEQTEKFKFPCVYTTVKNGDVNFWWSSVNNGHFGIPKVIWSNGYSTVPIVDLHGDFGLTQFSYAIVDDPLVLPSIQKAMESERFKKIMRPNDDGCTHKYNRKVIALFRKDFWKDFI